MRAGQPARGRCAISARAPWWGLRPVFDRFDRLYRVPEVTVLHGTSVGLGLGLYPTGR